MKKHLLSLFFIAFFSVSLSQNWTWMRGDNFNGATPGTYGTMGVPATTNTPGHRHGSATWVDASGNFWLFGGEGHSSVSTLSWLNDLWRYNPTTNEWTWIRGSNGMNATGSYGTQTIPSSSNDPGAREFSVSWVDNNGKFWMFGGDGFATTTTFGRLGDLWKYDPITNQWAWMNGPTTVDVNGIYGTVNVASSVNMPGSRYGAAHWADQSGNLWMFGGKGFPASGPQSQLNDLWKYNISTGFWTWMGGTNLTNQLAVTGTMSVPSNSTLPGATEFPCSWIDNTGNFYLFGGRGYATGPSAGYLNDVWKYNPTSGQWTWLWGIGQVNQTAVYGTQGVSAATNIAGGRYAAAYWKDILGNFWFFGGVGSSATAIGCINDLWKYNPSTNQFTWMKGSTSPNANGTYGTMGVPAAPNTPGARYNNLGWIDPNGKDLWLFGAEGFDINSTNVANMNDMWKFSIPCSPDSIITSPSQNVCTGTSVSFTATNQFPASVLWYTTSTSGSSIGSGSVISTPTLVAASSPSVYTYYAEANSCTIAPRTAVNITVNPIPKLLVFGNTVTCSGQSLSLVANGASNYTWSGGPTSPTLVVTPTVSGTFTVTGNNIPNCNGSTTVSISVNPLPTITVIATPSAYCWNSSGYSTLSGGGAQSYTWSTVNWSTTTTSNTVNVSPTTTLLSAFFTYTVLGVDNNGCYNSATVTINPRNCNGINETSNNSISIDLYPNPNCGLFKISVPENLNNASLRMINLLGECVWKCELSEPGIHVNVNLPKGVYFVWLYSSGQPSGSARLVIE